MMIHCLSNSRDLVQDLKASELIVAKCREDRYAQNLYAALCNMQWQRTTPWIKTAGELAVLDDSSLWSCTWRSAGGIVAELQGRGDYLSWYCSGMGRGYSPDDEIEEGFVSESTVTDEIRSDLASLGWYPVPWKD